MVPNLARVLDFRAYGFGVWRRNGGMNALYIWVVTVLCILFQDSKRTDKCLVQTQTWGVMQLRITSRLKNSRLLNNDAIR